MGNPLGTNDNFEIVVHHPTPLDGNPPHECEPENTNDNPDDVWPTSEVGFPSAFFVTGANSNTINPGAVPPLQPNSHYYDVLAEDLARRGFVVFSIQPANLNWSSEKREKALACAMHWARNPNATDPWSAVEDDPPRLAHSTFVFGHSRGGSGAYILPGSFGSYVTEMSETLGEYELCGHAAIAQRYGGPATADPTDIGPITDVGVIPFLGLLGSIDEDTKGDQITAYDNRLSDDAFTVPRDLDAAPGNDAVVHRRLRGDVRRRHGRRGPGAVWRRRDLRDDPVRRAHGDGARRVADRGDHHACNGVVPRGSAPDVVGRRSR
jgi:hypothetical protein